MEEQKNVRFNMEFDSMKISLQPQLNKNPLNPSVDDVIRPFIMYFILCPYNSLHNNSLQHNSLQHNSLQ
jgi:hypothetical protein